MSSVPLDDWREQVRGLLNNGPSHTGGVVNEGGASHAELPLKEIKSAVKTFSGTEWQLKPQSAFEFLEMIFPDRNHDEILFGILLLTVFKRKLPDGVWPAVDRWLEHVDDWQVCDQLAVNLAGRLVAEDKTRFKVLQRWSHADTPWRRRFAVMTSCVVLSKEGCRPKDVLKLVEPMMNDRTPQVQNAAAWALRQLAKLDEHMVLGFLKKWKGRCDHEIFREAALQLSPQAKMTLLKAKSHHTE